MAAPLAPASPLLDFKQPFDVALLDATIKAFYGAGSNQEVCALVASQYHRLPHFHARRCNSCSWSTSAVQAHSAPVLTLCLEHIVFASVLLH